MTPYPKGDGVVMHTKERKIKAESNRADDTNTSQYITANDISKLHSSSSSITSHSQGLRHPTNPARTNSLSTSKQASKIKKNTLSKAFPASRKMVFVSYMQRFLLPSPFLQFSPD